ncbi:MAG: 50S ribosomal protein L25 [Planctomycetota bacterium]|nr:50S ribosomal protein L25 [Planctomycetota bacterium]
MAKREIPKIQVQSRNQLGKRYAARLRKSGRMPAVVYGHKKEPLHVSVDQLEMKELLHNNTHLLEIVLDKKAEPCLVKDIQWNHLGSVVVHVDLARVDLTERVKIDVQLTLVGEAIGLKEAGNLLEHFITSLPIECLATEIPDRIRVDVSHLKVDESITVKELKLPEGVTTTLNPEAIIAAIHTIAEEVVAPVAGAEGGAEPEVIGGKKPEDGEAAPAAGAKEEKKK